MDYLQPNTIYNEDCLETMRRMPDRCINAVVTSPPYNLRLNVTKNQYKERSKDSRYAGKYDGFSDALPMDDYRKLHSHILGELLRVSKLVFWNVQIVTGNKDALFQILCEHHEKIRDVIVWDKGEGQPAMNPGMLNRGYELIIVLETDGRKGRQFGTYEFGRGTMSDIWRIGRGGKGDIKGHGAVFPTSLVGRVLQGWTKEGDLVYDPFMGTGTTAKACKELGRRYIGSEISAEYCQIAEERLARGALL